MLTDALLNFVPQGQIISMVGAAGVAIPIGNPIDILGSGSGTPPANIIGTQSAIFGAETGVGQNKPVVLLTVGTAFTTSNSATLTVAFQGAPDTGSAGGYLPGAWQTYEATATLTAAQLTAGQGIRLEWPVTFPDNAEPRFLRLLGVVASATNFTAGTISNAVVTMARDDQSNKYAQRNFNV